MPSCFFAARPREFHETATKRISGVAASGQTFERSDGDIAAVLEVLFKAPEFLKAEQQKFKDPVRFVVSAVRLAYDTKPVLNVGPVLNWINRRVNPCTADRLPTAIHFNRLPGQAPVN